MTDSERREARCGERVRELLSTLRTPAGAPAPRTRLVDDVMRMAQRQHAARETFRTIAALAGAMSGAIAILMGIQSDRSQRDIRD